MLKVPWKQENWCPGIFPNDGVHAIACAHLNYSTGHLLSHHQWCPDIFVTLITDIVTSCRLSSNLLTLHYPTCLVLWHTSCCCLLRLTFRWIQDIHPCYLVSIQRVAATGFLCHQKNVSIHVIAIAVVAFVVYSFTMYKISNVIAIAVVGFVWTLPISLSDSTQTL